MKLKKLFITIIFALSAFVGASLPISKSNFAHAVNPCTITFNSGTGGTCETASLETNSEGKLETLPIPQHEDFEFVAWKNADFEYVTLSTVFAEDTTLFPVWKQTFEISFDTEYSLSYNDSEIDSSSSANQILMSVISNTASISGAEVIAEIIIDNDASLILSTENASLNLNNLLIKYNGTNSPIVVSATTMLSIENCIFDAPNSTYAILFENNTSTIGLSGIISHSSSYLFNYLQGTSFGTNAVQLTENDLANDKKITCTIPYTCDNQAISSNFNSSPIYFAVDSENELYTAKVHILNSSSLYVVTALNYEFDTNGGEISDEYNSAFNYSSIQRINFPTSAQISKPHQSLDGFIGKLEISDTQKENWNLNSNTWYIDASSFASFISSGANSSDIEDYFYETPSEISSPTYFEYYINDTNDINYKFANFCLNNNTKPAMFALWSDVVYTITFDSNGGEPCTDISEIFGTEITLPTPEKTGYTFEGWFDVSDTEFETEITLSEMPDENLNLVAKWSLASFNLNIILTESDQRIVPVPYTSSLSSLPELDPNQYTKNGYSFVGWFADSSLQTPFSVETMPANDVDVYTKWTPNLYTLTFYYNNVNNSSVYESFGMFCDSDISMIVENPQIPGFVFNGWYTDPATQNPYTLTTMPANNLDLYAKWLIKNYYSVTFYVNNQIYGKPQTNLLCGATINYPTNPVVSGYRFEGWFTDTNFTESFNLTTVPETTDANIKVYAKIVQKIKINITSTPQIKEQSTHPRFVPDSNISGIFVYYFVNGEWVTDVPSDVGKYDVKIVRAEDNTYQAVYLEIKNGLQITPSTQDISWLIILLYSLFFVEILVTLLIVILRKRKASLTPLSIILPFATITTTQFIHFIVATILATFGFVLIIVELVKLHKTNIYEYAKTAEEEQEERRNKIKDISENESISENVEKLLKNEGLSNKK